MHITFFVHFCQPLEDTSHDFSDLISIKVIAISHFLEELGIQELDHDIERILRLVDSLDFHEIFMVE